MNLRRPSSQLYQTTLSIKEFVCCKLRWKPYPDSPESTLREGFGCVEEGTSHRHIIQFGIGRIPVQNSELRTSAGLFRVPRVYLSWAYLRFFSLLQFRRMNNLRVFSAINSSIPAAPTNHPIC